MSDLAEDLLILIEDCLIQPERLIKQSRKTLMADVAEFHANQFIKDHPELTRDYSADNEVEELKQALKTIHKFVNSNL